ncbi:Imm42 family immunity protein [Cupriavidus basilensis]|uniref:Imm42 family immunity protein n=1 Tax=Cupriavidus basilensis TaxID=68895 RepID=UPI003C2FB8D3
MFGDPQEFAVIYEVVPDWSTATIKNGLFLLAIESRLIPSVVQTITISAAIHQMVTQWETALPA